MIEFIVALALLFACSAVAFALFMWWAIRGVPVAEDDD